MGIFFKGLFQLGQEIKHKCANCARFLFIMPSDFLRKIFFIHTNFGSAKKINGRK